MGAHCPVPLELHSLIAASFKPGTGNTGTHGHDKMYLFWHVYYEERPARASHLTSCYKDPALGSRSSYLKEALSSVLQLFATFPPPKVSSFHCKHSFTNKRAASQLSSFLHWALPAPRFVPRLWTAAWTHRSTIRCKLIFSPSTPQKWHCRADLTRAIPPLSAQP